MSNAILSLFRKHYPQAGEVSDADLTLLVAKHYPQTVERDPGFARNVEAFREMALNTADSEARQSVAGLVAGTVAEKYDQFRAGFADQAPTQDPAVETQLRAFEAQQQMANEMGRGDVARQIEEQRRQFNAARGAGTVGDWADTMKPLVSLPRVPAAESLPGQVAAGAANAAIGFAEGLTSPENIVLLPVGNSRAVQAFFGSTMLGGVVPGARQTVALAREGDVQGAVEAGVGTGVSAALGAKLARGEAPRPTLAEVLAKELQRQVNRVELPVVPRPEAAQREGDGPLFRRAAPLGEVPGRAAAVPRAEFRIPNAEPGRPLDPFATDQGVGENVPAEGETAMDRMLRDRRQNKFREKAEAIRARRDAWINQTLEQAGERGSLEYVSTKRPERTVIVSPVPGQPGRWRTTQFDERGPIGHYEFDSREQAIRAVGGEHHTKKIAGPSYFGTGEYVLKRSKERYNIAADGRPLDPFATDQGVGENVPAEGWTPVSSFVRRERLANSQVQLPPETAETKAATKQQVTEAREFDRLLIEIGPEAGWVDNLDALAPQMETAKQDATTITARLARSKELNKLRYRAAQTFGANPDDLSPAARAALLPKLRDYVEQEIVPKRQAESLTAAIQPDTGKRPVNTGELSVGDRLNIDGEPVLVEAVDPDTGDVTLKDGTRFGRNTIADGQTIYVEEWKPTEQAAEFAPEATNNEGAKGPSDSAIRNPQSAILDAPESVADQKARLAREEAQAKTKADREKLAELQAKPLTGSVGDIGATDMFDPARNDLFSAPAPKQRTAGAEGTRSQAYPGGPLGEGPARPADNPAFSQFPMELPEAVKFARDLAGGVYPKLRDRLRLLGGTALGVFKHRDAAGKASIELRRDLFDLPESERARLREEALNYAKAAADKPGEVKAIFQERLDYLKREAFKENPLLALKVLWHEIGHWVDWLPDHMIQGRGNLFGRLASLKGYLEHTLPEAPGVPHRKIEPAERAKLQREAERALREELGPIEEIVRTIVTEEPIYERAGVTPEDVKNLLGMNAREANPELYRWFAEQDADVKKAILKAAMKGMVDARVANQGATLKQTGTRKVEREVREKVGREPTPAEIRERFQKLFREELARRKLAELEQVKAEIEPLIAWWRGTEKMEDYFKPSAEMYAEAFSIFANNPAAMAQRAPTYWRILNSYFGRKPEVAKLYREIQDSLAAGTVMRDRVTDLRRSWREDDVQSMDRARKQDRISPGAFLDNVLYHFDDRLGPVYRVARQAGQRGAPLRDAAGNYRYRATEHERLLGRANREVIEPLAAAGVDRVWLEEYIFHKHVTESRFVRDAVTKELRMIGNPMGWTPKNSLERLAEMKQQLGPENFAKLEAAQQTWRRIYEEQVLDLVKRSGLASPELMQAMEERVFYATFAKAKGEPAADGIAQLLEDSYGPQVGSHIYRQVGNLGEIKAPFTGTVLKSLALTSAAYRNILKRETVRAMLANDRGNIAEARVRWNGKRIEPVIVGGKGSKVGTLVYLDQGKVKAYYVPKAVADGIDGGAGHDNQLALASMKTIGALKAVFTQLNYGFWPVALVRDAAAWTMQLPGAGPLDLAKNFGPALKAAIQSQRGGRANPLADAALRRKMLISRADSRGVMNSVDNEFDLKVASFGLDPVKWGEQDKAVTKLVRAWNHYREFGQVFERTMKIAGMRYLDAKFPEMPEWQKQELVRERAGSPDFLTKGAAAPIVDWAAMFYNPWLQGVKAVGKAARENPFSFTAKATALIVAPTVMQSLAVRGMLGDDLKEMYGSVSDYDLTNYLVVPLGWHDRERKKVAYLRLPLWEPARLAHGSLFQSLTGRGQGVLSFAGGQLPGLNPLLANAAMWWDYTVNHRNPYDSFHGRLLLTDDAFKVGGAAAYEELAKQTWNSLGGSIVARFDGQPLGEPKPERLEKFLKLPLVSNALGRWVKVSNRGVFDADRKAAEATLQADAQRREAVRVAVDGVMAGRAFTESERVLLRDPAAADYYLKLLKKAMESRAALDQQRQQRLPTKGAREAAFAPVP